MTKEIIKTIFFILALVLTRESFSQNLTIFFSVTGDTICYSDDFGTKTDSSHIGHWAYIKCSDKNGELKTISTFTVNCEYSNTCLKAFNADTIKKYHLQLDGEYGGWASFVISVKPTNIQVVDTSTFGPKFIYQTKIIALITCKGKKLYSNQFDVMFKGNSPKDFPERDFVRIRSWHKKSKNKFYVDLNVKEYQIFKKPKDTEYSRFNSFSFIL